MNRNNTSGYVGVVWDRKHQKWCAQLRSEYKSVHVGYFKTAREAAIARDDVAVELHGEFAVTNQELGLLH